MDEVDSIGSTRVEGGSGGGDSEVQRTMLELLNQLDGFEATNKIKVAEICQMMHRSRIDCLVGSDGDEPYRYSGSRFATSGSDRSQDRISQPERDVEIRYSQDPLTKNESHTRDRSHENRQFDVRYTRSLRCPLDKVTNDNDALGASGAELKACCTEAGMFALRERRVHVTQEDFEMAVSKVPSSAHSFPLQHWDHHR